MICALKENDMMAIRPLVVFICIWLIFPSLISQPNRISFKKIDQNQGLSNNYCRVLLEDSQGFIWVGTTDGLNRYDGHSFKTYKHDPEDSLSLSGNYIWSLYEDRYGYIWVGTFGKGLNRFDPRTESFLRFELDSINAKVKRHPTIRTIYHDSRNRIWVGSNSAALCMENYDPENPSTDDWKPYFRSRADSIFIGSVYSFIEEENGLWMATTFGLRYYDFDKDQFYWFKLGMPGEGPQNSSILNKLIRKNDNELWIATRQVGLMQFKTWFENGIPNVSPKFYYEPTPIDPNEVKLSTGYIFDAVFTTSNDLWIGTGNGLDHLKLKEQKMTYYKKTDKSGLTGNAIFDMLLDSQGNMWLATEYGLSFYGKAHKKFSHLKDEAENLYRGVNAFYLQNDSILWIATSKGLIRYNRQLNTINPFLNQEIPSIGGANNFVNSIYPADEAKLWVVCRDSVRLFDTQTGKYSAYRPENHPYLVVGAPPQSFFVSLLDEKKKILWLGGRGKIYKFNLLTKKFEVYDDLVENNNIVQLFIDQSGIFIVCAINGVFTFNEENRATAPFMGLPENQKSFEGIYVKDILETDDGKLWMCSVNGLFCLDRKNNTIQQYREKDGLVSEHLRSIEEDENGFLWLGSNSGIIRFDPDEETFKNYTEADGLSWNLMQSRGSWKSLNGEMFFGSMNGFTSFKPGEIKPNPFPPKVHLTRMSILNEHVPVGKPDTANRNHQFFLEKDIQFTKEIHLSYLHRVFSFEFAALNYLNPEDNQYAFMLEGFDEEWVYTHDRKATYTNIDAGEYTFKVKGSNNDGIWNEVPTELKIIIHPPWWKTKWAYGFYLLAFSGLIWWFFRQRMEAVRREMKTKARIEKAKVNEREKVRARSSRDFHDEAGNKLTKISLYTGLLKNKANSDMEMMDFVNGIESNLKELSSGMRDFIWVLDPKHDSLLETLLRIKQFGDNLFEHSGIEFTFNNQISESMDINLDLNTRRNLLMIFKEAMNNCLKYAKAHEVKMTASLNDNDLTISLIDDGMGFAKENLGRINGLENMKIRANESGGNLTVEASPGLGTAIRFRKEIHPNG